MWISIASRSRPGGAVASAAAIGAALCALVAGSAVAEEGTVVGMVTTPDGAAAVDARVVLIELRRNVFVEADGSFRFDAVPAGRYHIQAMSPRFGSKVEEIGVAGGETRVEIELDLSAHRERVVVTATRGGRGSAEVVQPVNVLDRNDVSQAMQPTLGETLEAQPGISSTFFGAGSSRPIIRGQGGGRVRVLEGGLGVGDASTTSPDHAVSVDPFSAERIEILRGPSTLLYGGSAVGGVVNVLDQRIPEYAPKKSVSVAVDVLLGSVAGERSGALTLNGGGGAFAWHADGFVRNTDDYEIPGTAVRGDPASPSGTLPNSAVESNGGSVGLSWVGKNSFVGMATKRFNTRYGIPAELEEDAGRGIAGGMPAEGVEIDLEQTRYEARGGFELSAGALTGLRFNLGTSDYRHVELEGDQVGTTFSNDGLEARVELTHGRRGPWTGVFGVQLQNLELEAIGAEAFVPSNETETLAAFVVEELERGPLRYEFGARFERQEVGTAAAAAADPRCADPRDRDFDLISASFGLVWLTEDGHAIGGSLSRSVRGPSAEELYSCGEHLATASFEIGDPALDEESSLGLDVNFRRRVGRLSGEINLFRYDYADYIYEFDTGTTDPPLDPDGLKVFRFTQADAEFSGIELSGLVELLHTDDNDFDLEFNADVVEAELSDSGENLPRIPPASVGVGLRYRGSRWHAAAGVRRYADQNDNAPSETPSDGYTMVHANVGYRFVAHKLVHDLTLRGTNLTDEEARPHTSRVKDLVPLPGADLSVIYRLVF